MAATPEAIATKTEELRLFGLSNLEACIEAEAGRITLTTGRNGLPRHVDADSALAHAVHDALLDLKHALEPLILKLAADEAEREAAEALEEEAA
jgi:hypothetical protein